MCRRTTCRRCGKPTWAGCGAHVEQVLGDVPKAQRCQCHTGAPVERKASTATAPRRSPRSWWRRSSQD